MAAFSAPGVREGSMDHPAEEPGPALDKLRRYLCVLACMHLDRHLWAKLDPEDVVQSTFAEALAKWDQFQGQGEEQLKDGSGTCSCITSAMPSAISGSKTATCS